MRKLEVGLSAGRARRIAGTAGDLPRGHEERVPSGPLGDKGLALDRKAGLRKPPAVSAGVGMAPPHVAAGDPEPVLLKTGPRFVPDPGQEESARLQPPTH